MSGRLSTPRRVVTKPTRGIKDLSKTTMSTVDKALSLLRFFSATRAELGLSELARISGYDKTTTLRCLTALERNGFVEQNVVSRKYRVGVAPIHLAQIREQSFPIRSVILPHLEKLAKTIGETAHGTLMIGQTARAIAVSEPDRALFVHVDTSSVLPWHATASGLAIAAFVSEDTQEALWDAGNFEAFTKETPTDRTCVENAIQTCQIEGVARAPLTFDKDVIGTAAPIFGQGQTAIGSIAIAAVALRVTPELQSLIDTELRNTSRTITHELGGRIAAIQDIRL